MIISLKRRVAEEIVYLMYAQIIAKHDPVMSSINYNGLFTKKGKNDVYQKKMGIVSCCGGKLLFM